MSGRRFPATLVVLIALAAVVLLGASRRERVNPVFTSLGAPTTPFVPKLDFITSTWFCPGVPIGVAGSGGTVVIENPGDAPLTGQVTAFTDAVGASPIAQTFEVAARQTTSIDLAATQPNGSYVSGLVEIRGGGGIVEQVAKSAEGAAVAPCSNSVSNSWYFADGYTKDDSTDEIVITNPFPDDAIIDFSLATSQGNRSPASLTGYPVKGRSVSVVKLQGVVRDDAVLAVEVTSTRGRVVVGRSQHYLGADRSGYTMTLGAPALTDQSWFAEGEKADGISERYSVLNGSDNEITVQAVFLGVPLASAFANDQQLTVAPHGVATLDTKDVQGLPAGRHGVVFSTTEAASMVVERAITRPLPGGGAGATSVVLGQPARAAGPRWSLAVGSSTALDNVLIVMNIDNEEAKITVKALGPGGEVAVPGMEQISLGANQVTALGLSDPSALDHPLVIESTSRVYVERSLPRGPNLRGRSGSFALPG